MSESVNLRGGTLHVARAYSNDDWGTRPLTIKLRTRSDRPLKHVAPTYAGGKLQ